MRTNQITENHNTLMDIDIETAILIMILGLLFSIGIAIF